LKTERDQNAPRTLQLTGGFVYRGTKYADLFGGHYLFADYSLK